MKIAIIGYTFSGATLPLAKELFNMGHKVDCFYLANKGSKSTESIDYDYDVGSPGELIKIEKSNRLYNYLPLPVNVYLISVLMNRRFLKRIHLGWILPQINHFYLKRSIRTILSKSYDVVNIIIQTNLELYIAQRLFMSGVRCVFSFHEVLESLTGKPRIKTVVREAIALGTPLIIHSEKTKLDLCNLYMDKNMYNRLFVLPYGTFDSYTSYGEGKRMISITTPFLLYLGTIHPYKGLKYLYEAISLCRTDYNVVVAGNGYDPILEKMRGNDKFIVINRYIQNEELVWLMKNCEAVICPYVEASQSGLVQTAFVFKKPVISTKVGAFGEIIINNHNGFLANPADAQSLAKAINLFESHKLENESFLPDAYQWNNIADKYVNILKSI